MVDYIMQDIEVSSTSSHDNDPEDILVQSYDIDISTDSYFTILERGIPTFRYTTIRYTTFRYTTFRYRHFDTPTFRYTTIRYTDIIIYMIGKSEIYVR